ncbi:RadC family protein [Stieleria varia]|uniref:MPN domain-containing protein n=1 Tax=Stieleria varia TaxID=2528005 RepID=A0A5C6B2A0_9BACT|nr:DNA repair protein RadC [Stieleria varia]TWU06038.1 hypothetical protein Pla52n_17560 [Stieleria varia]
MPNTRKEKLRLIFDRLLPMQRFSRSEAKYSCHPLTAQFVTATLNDLVREGILTSYISGDVETLAWKTNRQEFDPNHWIQRVVHGDQVTEQPEQERPRERLLSSGAESLSDADLMAILIRVGVKGESAIAAGKRLARRFQNNLCDLRRCSKDELRAISPAITVVSYAGLLAGIELGRRVAASEQRKRDQFHTITSTTEAIAFCEQEFHSLAVNSMQEEFHIVTLSTKHAPINTHLITRGTLDASLVHPREVFRPAIRDMAAAVILVHNHPSGDPTPSREDHQVTQRLTEAGKLLGITVLDHIVVASRACVSIREH